jgi:hypothetical protein
MAGNTAAIEAVRKNSLRKMGDDKNASAKYSNDSMMKMDSVSNTSAINTGNIETRNNDDIKHDAVVATAAVTSNMEGNTNQNKTAPTEAEYIAEKIVAHKKNKEQRAGGYLL